MRVSREQAAESRAKIIDAAARNFRERGLDGIGVADLMKDAGFTHGGFYAHFESKEDLMAQACARALDGGLERWGRLREAHPQGALQAIVTHYLSERHVANPGAGCAIAALASELPRQGSGVRAAVTTRLRALMEILSSAMPGRTRASRRKKALAAYASLLGGVVLARSVDDAAFAREILDAVSDVVTSRA
jgi:TetR/AcrR family transcriptional repressor of nem operon